MLSLKLLFNTPQQFIKDKQVNEIWGKELPHVVKEIYGTHHLQLLGKDISKVLTLKQWLRLSVATWKYQRGYPYEYVWGKVNFQRRDFIVSPAVLIPRPETEEWVSQLLADIHHPKSKISAHDLRVLDIGTGSGIIAITLQAELPEAKITAIDISKSSISVAKKNTDKILEYPKSIRLLNRDVFKKPVSKLLPPSQEKFNLVVSNPPYVGWQEKNQLAAEVVNYEPHQALFAGESGLNFYQKLADLLPQILEPGGWVYLELGWQQAHAVQKLFKYLKQSVIIKDMFSKERVFKGRL